MTSAATERRFEQRLAELSAVWHEHSSRPPLAWVAAAVMWAAAPQQEITMISERLNALADALLQWAARHSLSQPLSIEAVAAGFVALGFRGNTEAYYDVRNSFLEDVITRRVGIPITLSVVFIELAQRFGLRCEGVNFPGHFLVRYSGPDGVGYLDPFHQCRWLDAEDLRQLLCQVQGDQAQLRAEDLRVAQPVDIFLRMLWNVYHVALNTKDWCTAVRARRMQLVVSPDDPYARRDIGLLYLRLEHWSEALSWLESQKRLTSSEAERQALEPHITKAKKALACWN